MRLITAGQRAWQGETAVGARRQFLRRRLLTGRSVATAVLLVFSLASAVGYAEAPRHPTLAVDPFPNIADLERRTDVLARWLSLGYSPAVLLLVDVTPGLRPLGDAPATRLAEIRRAQAAGSPAVTAPPGSVGDLSPFEHSFVRAAIALGLVKEVYWVTPFANGGGQDLAGAVGVGLREAGVTEEELRSFVLKDDCLRGTVAGTPFAACAIAGLPPIAEPVLFSFDTEFILSAATFQATNPLVEIRRLLTALAVRKYAVSDGVVSASVEIGFVPPDMRWIGESVSQAIQNPALLSLPAPPQRWRRLQEMVFFLRSGKYSEMHHELLLMLTIHEDDPALQLSIAQSLMGLGRPDEALEHAKQACRLYQGYCSGLPWLGLELYATGDIDGGERFFAAGTALMPKMTFGQLERGLSLIGAGRRAAALQVFRGLSEGGKIFPGAFLAGALSLEAGDRQEAVRLFDRAIETLRWYPDAAADHPVTTWAVRKAAELYREMGAPAKAEMLEANPRLMRREDAGPPPPPP